MTIQFYLLLHLAGISLILLALGGLAYGSENGRKLLSAAHGIGLVLSLVGGFGLLARYQIATPWPAWVYVKIGIWLAFGGSATLLRKLPHLSKPIWWAAWVLFLLAAYLGINMPA
ncbi:MAG: hypothetical protein HOH74_20655 [Gemmatimonadetes bacterium]|jgi:hypothetical protein|nr:hypothetical protein [Gemmatimonadota bacterium]